MRRVLWITTVIIVVCGLSSPAISARKPPKSICYEMDGSGSGSYDGGCIILNFKSSGMKTRSQHGTSKFYHVRGAIGLNSPFADEVIFGAVFWNNSEDKNWEGYFTGGDVDEPTHCYLFLEMDESLRITCRKGDEASFGYDTIQIECRTVFID